MTVVPIGLEGLDPARWQFGITTVYHFVLVPFTIGMSLLIAIMETMWYRTGKDHWLKATRFFGKLFLINFALGVATGIVQEFQFGMNWSEYSRFVGDIFGAPLAFEALLSFFMESTFLGIWIFGWGKISKKAHVAMAWLVCVGVNTSMLFILGANSWMQHPVGAVFNAEQGRANLDGAAAFLAVVTSSTMWITVFHVFTSSLMVASTVVAGLSIWWMVRAVRAGEAGKHEAREVWQPISRWGMSILLIAGVLTVASGHIQGQHLVYYQPTKMAAAEGLCEGNTGNFSILAFYDCESASVDEQGNKTIGIGHIPGALGFVAHNSFSATIPGMKESSEMLTKHFEEIRKANPAAPNFEVSYTEYDKAPYAPYALMTFWSFRLMMATGMFSVLLALVGLFLTRDGRVCDQNWLSKLALLSLPMPFLGANFGWIFTEIGRQPFLVYPNIDMQPGDPGAGVYMLTQDGLSGAVSPVEVMISMTVFTLLYAALGVVWFILMKRYAKEGVNTPASDGGPVKPSQDLSFAY